MLTQNELKEWIRYDPVTGLFYWNKDSINGKRKIGKAITSTDSGGYVIIRVQKKKYKAHRLAWLYMTGSFPTETVDHIDGNSANNVWTNLREAARGQNQQNSKISRNNKSGIKGVCWAKSREKWFAYISIDGQTKNLGYFENIDQATAVIKTARQQYHKEFANNG